MTNRTAIPRASRVALLALLAVLLGALPVRAASSIEIEARALVGGRYEIGGWAAVAVSLVNEGAATEGHVSAETRSGTMRRFVEMPAGARKVVPLYIQPEAFQRRITVRFEEPNGTVESVVEVRAFEQVASQLAVVGDGNGTLRPQLLGSSGNAGIPEPITLRTTDLPERPEPLAGLAGIVWADDSSGLTEAQRRSVARWVADGGQLVLLGGPDWQARTAGFADLLPLDGLAAVDGVAHEPLATWAGADEPAVARATASSGKLRDGARALVRADDGTILASMRPIGAGRVVLLGSDLATEPYRGWDGSPGLWSRVLPAGGALDPFMGGGNPGREDSEDAMSQALGTVPSLEVPPAELLLAVIVGYILLIGPISYVVLRRLDRRELAWLTAPALVVVFTACSYGIGTTLKGGEVIVNQISLIRTSHGGGTAAVQSYAGVFSPERSTFDLSVDADALMGQLRSLQAPGGRESSDVVAEQGDPARLRGLSIGVFGFEGVRADALVAHEPALEVEWSEEDGGLVGTVTNVGQEAIADVAYVSTAGGTRIGDLQPGGSAEFAAASRNANGTPASDQVYGFGGFDGSGEGERTTMLRRQVINALVGYGGSMPGTELGDPVGARGPFIIGWRTSPGPLPITVEGVSAQHLAQSVEIVSVRPAPAGGTMRLGPGSMLVTVLETDGDADTIAPGVVTIGNGSAVIGISLPLEAAGMAVTELEILAGPDPSMVIGDQGGFGEGFWPPGYRIELRDPRSGDWSPLGDLADSSRFPVDEPSSAMSAAGRIEVRVTGAEIEPDFGQNPIFVSARVSGVVGE